MENLTSLINDLTKAVEIRNKLSELSTKTSDPVIEIIDYALDHNIISSTRDVLKVSQNVPDDIADLIVEKYDAKVKKKISSAYKAADAYQAANAFNYRCEASIHNRRC